MDRADAELQLITSYLESQSQDIDPDIYAQKAIAQFGCLCGKRKYYGRRVLMIVFTFRQMQPSEARSDILESLRFYAPMCRQDLSDLPANHPRGEEIRSMLITIDVYEAEIVCELQDWDALTEVIEVC